MSGGCNGGGEGLLLLPAPAEVNALAAGAVVLYLRSSLGEGFSAADSFKEAGRGVGLVWLLQNSDDSAPGCLAPDASCLSDRLTGSPRLFVRGEHSLHLWRAGLGSESTRKKRSKIASLFSINAVLAVFRSFSLTLPDEAYENHSIGLSSIRADRLSGQLGDRNPENLKGRPRVHKLMPSHVQDRTAGAELKPDRPRQ